MTKFRCGACGSTGEFQVPSTKSNLAYGNELSCPKCGKKGMYHLA